MGYLSLVVFFLCDSQMAWFAVPRLSVFLLTCHPLLPARHLFPASLCFSLQVLSFFKILVGVTMGSSKFLAHAAFTTLPLLCKCITRRLSLDREMIAAQGTMLTLARKAVVGSTTMIHSSCARVDHGRFQGGNTIRSPPAWTSWKLHKGRRLFHTSHIVASSPAVEEAAAEAAARENPLVKEDLVAHLMSGCKPRAEWRIGTEHEKFGFQLDTLEPMTFDHISKLLDGMASRFGYARVMEGENIIGLEKDGASVSLEPGGQFELSGAPLEDIHACERELNMHLEQVNIVGKELGLGFAGIGFEPKWPLSDRPSVPKARYEVIENYIPKIGGSEIGYDTMYQTCTAQVNLDFDSEQDMINKLRVGLSLQPIATALFANSPFSEGKPNGYLSYRSNVWTEFDANRTGELPFVFDEDFGFEKYTEYALNVPMLMVFRNGIWNDVAGASFKDFMAGKLAEYLGERPTLNDWMNHLGNIYPEVRLKKYLEMRGADCGPQPLLNALPALWVGLLYDEQSLKGALDITRDWTNDDREMLRQKVPKHGLHVPFRNGLLQHVAQDVVKLAKDGLSRRGRDEGEFLAPIEEIATSGVTQAERMLKLYEDNWGRKS